MGEKTRRVQTDAVFLLVTFVCFQTKFGILIHLDLFFCRKNKTLLNYLKRWLFVVWYFPDFGWLILSNFGWHSLPGAGGRECKVAKGVIWVVVSNIFYFHHYLGKISQLTHIFQMG